MTEPEEAGTFAWDVRVAASGRDSATVFVRKHRFEVGAPISFDRDDPAIAALEYVLGALGADVVAGFQRQARKHRLPVDSIEATVHARLNNPLTFIGVVGETGDPGMKSVALRLYVSTSADPAETSQAWEETKAASPLLCTLRHSVDLELSIKTLA